MGTTERSPASPDGTRPALPEPRTDPDRDTDTDTDTETGADTDTETGADTDTETETETENGADTETENGADAKDGAGADTKDGADAEAAAKPDAEQRWAAFAPVPTRPPGRLRRAAAVVGRPFGHEWTLAVLGGFALAVLMTWPALRHPRYTLPQDLGDPALVTWILAWPGHILLTDPGSLWHGNAFFPDSRWSLAFTDSLLGYAPLSLLGEGIADALLRYNLVFGFAYALAFIGAYALVRQLGAHPAAALVAGIAFAYAPWRLAHAGHLHVLSTGGIALALAMLARGHGWSLRRRGPDQPPGPMRPGWIVAGWLVAAWQVTLGFGVGLVFGYVLAGLVVVAAAIWLLRRVVRRVRRRPAAATGTSRPGQPVGRVLGANLAGGAIFTAIGILMALPYLTVVRLYPQAERTLGEVDLFSPPLRGFLIAPRESWLWGATHEAARAAPVSADKGFWAPEMSLLPGFALVGLATAGLIFSIWSVRTRLWLAAGVVVSIGLAMGTELFGGFVYEYLYEWLPGWSALRTPGRMVIWTTLLLAILAAGAISAVAARSRDLALHHGSPQPGGWLRLALLLPALLVLVEGVGTTPQVPVPPRPAALASAEGPVLVLPSNAQTDTLVMLWSTDGWFPVVNGNSGFAPPSLHETRRVTQSFPDPASVDYLRGIGVSTVVVLPDRLPGTPWENALAPTGVELGVTREEIDGAVVFHLNR